ncbi:MAG: endolytic transglycosylase MltG [Coriobacteriia bacterium]|nr:endolytic transglycosylase MltG [Coriobacteriia bacterium]
MADYKGRHSAGNDDFADDDFMDGGFRGAGQAYDDPSQSGRFSSSGLRSQLSQRNPRLRDAGQTDPGTGSFSRQRSYEEDRPAYGSYSRARSAASAHGGYNSYNDYNDDDPNEQDSSYYYDGDEDGTYSGSDYDPDRPRQHKASRKSAHFVSYDLDGVRRKSRPVRSIVMGAVAIVVLALLIFGGYKLLQNFGVIGGEEPESVEVSIFVPQGSTTAEIAKILKAGKVISSENAFITYVKSQGVEDQLLSGQYTFNTRSTDEEALAILLGGPAPASTGNKLTIPEGLTVEQTARVVESACGIPAADFIHEAYSADKYEPDYPTLHLELVYNNSLEGYLYPKTYLIPPGADAEYVVRVLLNQFAKEIANLDMSYAEPRNLDIFDIVIIASMIEKETAQPDERPLVSSVIYNRLHVNHPLQICATVIYAMGDENYDGHPLLIDDLNIDSPYNTYLNYSLPAGPICSPHISSIEAAAHPRETDYFFYVLTSLDGTHTFCETDDQFREAEQKYHELFNIP